MIALLLRLALALAACPAAGAADDLEARARALLERMTLEEKLGQLQQLDGSADGSYDPRLLALARAGRLGSTINVRGARRVNELQREAVERSRLKIPILFAFDVIHGYRTVFPIPLALASGWDPDAVERAARIAADEAEAAGVRWTFSPMLDVARDPRWGRIAESAGEDPVLASALARAWVRGYQGDDPSRPGRVAATAKHWVAYGAAEGGRDYNTTDVTERALRETYFPPFEAALNAGVATFMSAFNDIDGTPASADPFTLTEVLRGEWEFPGFVVSDYTAVKELIHHGVAADGAEAARLALGSGVDMEMVSTLYAENVPGLLREGKLSPDQVDEAVLRVLRTKLRLGLFLRPYADESRQKAALLTPENLAAARAIAGRSLVLLKNDGDLLPLSKALRSIAVIGPLGDSREGVLGSWTGDGRPEDAVTLLAGMRAKLPAARVVFAKGCEVSSPDASGFSAAVAAAREADAVVLALGESADMSGEATSRAELDLPGRQLDLAKAVLAAGKPTAVVLFNGRPLAIPWLAGNAPAILEAWQPGTAAGHAIADALFGDVDPGGKLPATFPRSVGQVPLYYNHKNTGRPASAEKWSSKYIDSPVTPLFPFGYGLSYTRFNLDDLRLDAKAIPPDGGLAVSVSIENAGRREGDEVVQLYLRRPAASVTRPVRELKGFKRVTLRPGEKRRLEFLLGPEQLGFYDRSLRYAVEPGACEVFVGTSSAGGLEGRFEILRPQ